MTKIKEYIVFILHIILFYRKDGLYKSALSHYEYSVYW